MANLATFVEEKIKPFIAHCEARPTEREDDSFFYGGWVAMIAGTEYTRLGMGHMQILPRYLDPMGRIGCGDASFLNFLRQVTTKRSHDLPSSMASMIEAGLIDITFNRLTYEAMRRAMGAAKRDLAGLTAGGATVRGDVGEILGRLDEALSPPDGDLGRAAKDVTNTRAMRILMDDGLDLAYFVMNIPHDNHRWGEQPPKAYMDLCRSVDWIRHELWQGRYTLTVPEDAKSNEFILQPSIKGIQDDYSYWNHPWLCDTPDEIRALDRAKVSSHPVIYRGTEPAPLDSLTVTVIQADIQDQTQYVAWLREHEGIELGK